MDNFIFRNPTRILFGKGMEAQVGTETAKYAKKVLVHYGGGSVKKSGLLDQVTASLKAAGVDYLELGGVQPNPRLSLVHQGVKLCRENGVELILAVGGGSVIDSSKAIAMGVPYRGMSGILRRQGDADQALPWPPCSPSGGRQRILGFHRHHQ
jgi:alcohol dehydrogenase YqhD (iron-dependent ADH family)